MKDLVTLLHPVTGQERFWARDAEPTRLAAVLPGRGTGTPPNNAVQQLSAAMQQFIRPQAAMNWLAPQVASMTPQRIEMILRGALTGDYTQQWQLFDLMEDTWPRLMKNLNEVKRAATKMEFKLQPWAEEEEAPTDSAIEKRKFVSRAMRTMRPDATREENGFHQTIYDLLDAWGKGVSVLEILWNQIDDGIVPRATIWANPYNYGWAADGTMGLNITDRSVSDTTSGSYSQSAANLFGGLRRGQYVAPFTDNKFLVAVAKSKTAHASTAALLRPLAWWWCAANFSSDWLLNFAQIFGLPIRIANYDPTQPGLFEKVCEMLENMGTAAWAALPNGAEVKIVESSKGSAGNATPQGDLIDRADKQCDLLVLGQTLTTDTGSKGSGSRALGEVHADVRDDIIQAAADFVADVFNTQLVPAILQLNYGETTEAPLYVAAPKKAEDKKANADRFAVLASSGLKIPVAYVYENQEIPMPVGDEEVLGAVSAATDSTAKDGPTRTGQDAKEGKETPADETGEVADDGDETPAANRASQRSYPDGAQARHHDHEHGLECRAHDAQANRLMESVTGVDARWLGGLRPYYRELIAMAENAKDDAAFEQALRATIARSEKTFPDLFAKMDVEFLADRLEGVMGAACVNGAVNGFLKRVLPGRGTGGAR